MPPISLQPTLAARFRLKDLTANAGGDFDTGSIQVFYHGTSMGITSQVSIVSANHRLAFESVETEAMDFASNTLNGIVWTPDDETQAKLALTNTTSAPLSVTATSDHKVQSLTLKGRETCVLELEDFLGGAPATLLSLEHNGPLGALVVTGFALNRRTGFSSNLNFVDCATVKSMRLAAAHVRFGQAEPQEGFPAGTTFRAPLVIANTMHMPTEVQISVDYTVQSVAKRVALKPVTLGAGEVKQIELSKQMARSGVTGPVEDAGVDINYDGMPGTVIARLTSFNDGGDYSFDVPVKDPTGQGNGSYPWRLDNGYTTVVHLKNTLDKEVTAVVQVRYDGGNYNPDRIKLAPFQTMAIDIRKLRDGQKKDIRGGVMPQDVESGQVSWIEEEVGSMIGRAEVANVGNGLASNFSCGECGPCQGIFFKSCAMTPTSGTAPVGQFGYMFAPSVMKQDCHFTYGPYNVTTTINWSSTNTPIVTVDGAGNERTVAPGSATILARWSEVVGYNYSCAAIYANVTASATCDVTPVVSIDFTASGIPLANGTPPPGTWPSFINSVTISANGTPGGGTYYWQIGEPATSYVTLSNVNSQTVTVTSKAASINYANVLIEVDYTLNGRTGISFIVTQVQKPTSLRYVSSTNSTPNNCSAYPGTTGLQKNITWQLMDQFNPPDPILFQIPGSDDLAALSGQNGCAISPFTGTPASDKDYTDLNGMWPHHYDFCTGRCPCQTNGVQHYFFNGFEIDQNFTFSCSGITVAGH